MSRRWTDKDSRTLRALHNEGRSLHSIAAEMGRSKQTVSKYASRMGLSWERGQTAAAAEAVHVDNRARRAALESALLDDAERLRRQLWEPSYVFNIGGAENKYTEQQVEEPPAQDKRHLIQSASIALTAANKLHELNSAREAEAAKSTLTRLREALSERVRDSSDQ